MNTLDVNMSLAELFVRLFLGIILIFQGYDKLFVVKIKNVVSMFNSDSSKKYSTFIGCIYILLYLHHRMFWRIIINYWIISPRSTYTN